MSLLSIPSLASLECVHFDQFEDVTSEAEVISDNLTGPRNPECTETHSEMVKRCYILSYKSIQFLFECNRIYWFLTAGLLFQKHFVNSFIDQLNGSR